MRCNWIHILRGVPGEPEPSPWCPRGLAEPLLPPLSRSIAASGVAVFNGSGNRGWLSICGQLGTISWHRRAWREKGKGRANRVTPIDSQSPSHLIRRVFCLIKCPDKCMIFDSNRWILKEKSEIFTNQLWLFLRNSIKLEYFLTNLFSVFNISFIDHKIMIFNWFYISQIFKLLWKRLNTQRQMWFKKRILIFLFTKTENWLQLFHKIWIERKNLQWFWGILFIWQQI